MALSIKKIIINHSPWQTRVAVLANDRLQDIFFDTHSRKYIERSFFKGRVLKILPGIQTAFVDIGQSRSGFLHRTEIDRALAAERIAKQTGEEVATSHIKHRLDINKVFREHEDILVQVLKEPFSEKGAKLTTCFTLPGRLLVLMPNIPQIGISKKIEDKQERSRLRALLLSMLPPGMGAIVRTTAAGKSPENIKREMGFLISTWKAIKKKFKKADLGEKIHEDLPLALRVVRDHMDDDVEMIITDNKKIEKTIYTFVKNFNPLLTNKIRYYSNNQKDLFEYYDINTAIDSALQKKVSLKSGGSLIIETAEAMTVIDVNTGKFTGTGNLEDTILKNNLEAAEEIVTQLRLRNIGGLIVIDFIDMAHHSSRQNLSRTFEKLLKEQDKFQSVVLKVSEFGLVQMTRKRSGKTLLQQLTNPCTECHSLGFVKSIQTHSFEILNKLKHDVSSRTYKGAVTLTVAHSVFHYLIDHEHQSLILLEKALGCRLILESKSIEPTQFEIHYMGDT